MPACPLRLKALASQLHSSPHRTQIPPRPLSQQPHRRPDRPLFRSPLLQRLVRQWRKPSRIWLREGPPRLRIQRRAQQHVHDQRLRKRLLRCRREGKSITAQPSPAHLLLPHQRHRLPPQHQPHSQRKQRLSSTHQTARPLTKAPPRSSLRHNLRPARRLPRELHQRVRARPRGQTPSAPLSADPEHRLPRPNTRTRSRTPHRQPNRAPPIRRRPRNPHQTRAVRPRMRQRHQPHP